MCGIALTKAGLTACLNQVREASEWDKRRKAAKGGNGAG